MALKWMRSDDPFGKSPRGAELELPRSRLLLVSLRDHGLIFLEQPSGTYAQCVMGLLLALEKGAPRHLHGLQPPEWRPTI